jgi:predicted dehydrogenase
MSHRVLNEIYDNKPKINYSIIGFGGIAKTHAIGTYIANLTLGLPYNLNLKSIVTRNPLQFKVPGSNNIMDMKSALEDAEIQFVDICTPNDAHKSNILKALDHNKAIYCEKPLAANYTDAFEMTNAVNSSGVKNSTALIYRFLPAVRLVKEAVEENSIGDIIDFKINLFHKSYLNPNKKGSWRTSPSSGGGALLDLGVHLIDMIYFTLGNIESVSAKNRIFFKDRTEVDEISHCSFSLQNGTKGSLEVSRIFADLEEPTTFTIYGSKGSIKMNSHRPYTIDIYNYEKNSVEVRSAQNKKYILQNYPEERASFGFHQDCHIASIVNFANEIYLNQANPITPTFEDALKAQKVIEAAYRSSKTGGTILIDTIY